MLLLIQVVLILQDATRIVKQGIVTATNGIKKEAKLPFLLKIISLRTNVQNQTTECRS